MRSVRGPQEGNKGVVQVWRGGKGMVHVRSQGKSMVHLGERGEGWFHYEWDSGQNGDDK